MKNNTQNSATFYRWIILMMAWLSLFLIAMAWYVMPTLQQTLLDLYNINTAQYSTALTAPFVVAAILAIAGGMLADRFGIRITGSIGIIIAGIGFLARAQVGDYMDLLIPMLAVGVGLGIITPNLPKLVGVWFPPHEAGLATGIFNTGLMGGFSTGLVMAPYLPGWSTGNIFLGAVVVITGILFFIIVKDTPAGKELPPTPIMEGLQRGLRSKNVWALNITLFVAMAGMQSFMGILPTALNQEYGLSMVTGGQIASLITYAGLLGSLTLPVLADKIGKVKQFMVILPIGFSAIMLPTWILGDNTAILWIGTTVAGYIGGGSLPIFMTVLPLLPHLKEDPVEAQHVGGASGIITAFMNLGGWAGLPFIVMPIIMNNGYTVGFTVAAILFASQAIFSLAISFPKIGLESEPEAAVEQSLSHN